MGEDAGTYLVCMRVTDLAVPAVPSRELACTRCSLPVWASRVLLATSPKPVMPMCFPCAAAVVPDQPSEITETLRKELHGAGWTDDDIAKAKMACEDALQRLRQS